MAEILLLVALFVVCLYYEKKKNERKEHDEWLYYCRICLLNIVSQFRDDCHKKLTEQLKEYTRIVSWRQYRDDNKVYFFSSRYQNYLEELENNYLRNVESIARERLQRFHFSSLPEYLLEEYYDQIKASCREYRDTGYAMSQHLRDLSSPVECTDK